MAVYVPQQEAGEDPSSAPSFQSPASLQWFLEERYPLQAAY